MITWILLAVIAAWIASIALLIVIGAPAVIPANTALRRSLVMPHISALFKRILPAMSATERDALEAGTIKNHVELRR